MIPVERELDRTLTLLRNKIREQGFTQLQVQAQLSWGRSYISQLLTKQKSLRVEQVLRILQVIDVEPAAFYKELYRFPVEEAKRSENAAYPTIQEQAVAGEVDKSEVAQEGELPEGIRQRLLESEEMFLRSKRMVSQMAQLLVDRNIISEEEKASLEVMENLESADSEDPAN